MSSPDEHDHDHGHKEDGSPLNYADDSRHDYNETDHYPLMVEAIRQLVIEKEIVKAGDVQERLDFMDSRGIELGAKIVVKAWTDAEFKTRLLADGTAAVAELDIPMADAELVVVENTADTHNLIVCTLCSCYPRTILGLPPDWYKSKTYRSRAVNEPRAVIREFGTVIADDVTVRVHDSNADMRYLVLPARPQGTDGWNDEQLTELITRDSLVGATVPAVIS
ncbi:MAG: nitrile hydratase subunit alpha [Rhodospirillaceae bacterium]|jgi:nitrile hydratase alpha subunit|nr:nitrile hydratase subunit alpha [Rhodospirillaceae bacterium]